MTEFDTHGWVWDHSEYSEAAVGDSGPWVWWLPLAWRAVADPLGNHQLPPPPIPKSPHDIDGPGSHAYLIAWWAPLLHLLFFGLGWPRPDIGLARWHELGQPDDDPVLRVVKRWWGPFVEEVLAWTGKSAALSTLAADIATVVNTPIRTVSLPDRWARQRKSDRWRDTWASGGDNLHLSYHVPTPVQADELNGREVLLATDFTAAARAVLSLPEYGGWYTELSNLGAGLPDRAGGHSWRVSVVVRPLGSLGVYRLSRQTGRWFSGRHRWHQLGLDEPFVQ